MSLRAGPRVTPLRVRAQALSLLRTLSQGALGYSSLDGLLRLGQMLEKMPGKAKLGTTLQELASALAHGTLDPSASIASPVKKALEAIAAEKSKLDGVESALRKRVREARPRCCGKSQTRWRAID